MLTKFTNETMENKYGSLVDKFRVKLTLNRPMLATNPRDPTVHGTHIIDKERKMIEKGSKTNKELLKYLDAIQISDTRKAEEVDNLIKQLEEMAGYQLAPEQRDLILTGKIKELKETFQELEMRGITVFFRDDNGMPAIGDHMIYGYLKAAAEALIRAQDKDGKKNGTFLSSTAYTHSIINQHIKCTERFLIASKDIEKLDDGAPRLNQRSLRAKTMQGDRVTLTSSEELPAGTAFEFTLEIVKGSPAEAELVAKLFYFGTQVGLGQWRNARWGAFTFEMEGWVEPKVIKAPKEEKIKKAQIIEPVAELNA